MVRPRQAVSFCHTSRRFESRVRGTEFELVRNGLPPHNAKAGWARKPDLRCWGMANHALRTLFQVEDFATWAAAYYGSAHPLRAAGWPAPEDTDWGARRHAVVRRVCLRLGRLPQRSGIVSCAPPSLARDRSYLALDPILDHIAFAPTGRFGSARGSDFPHTLAVKAEASHRVERTSPPITAGRSSAFNSVLSTIDALQQSA